MTGTRRNGTGGNCSGTITDGGNNMEDGTICGLTASSSLANTDPLLSTPGFYGGPTQTFALLPGSPAIDAGAPGICAADPVNNLDQRGATRPSACDMGAFESGGFILAISGGNNQSATINSAFSNPLTVSVFSANDEPVDGGTVSFNPPASGANAVITGSPALISGGLAQVTATANDIVGSYDVNANTSGMAAGVDFALHNTCNSSSITVTNSNDDGPGSLRRAIINICPGGTITFTGDTTIYLASTLTIDKNMTIDGIGHTITVSGDTDDNGSGNVRVFYVNPGFIFNLNNLVVSKGYDAGSGGGIYNNLGTLTITNSTFSGNGAIAEGGGIYLNGGTLTITGSTFSANSASHGGGIFVDIATLNISSSAFLGNSGRIYGGGIYNAGTVTIANSTFSGNSAGTLSGGIFNQGTATITNSTFSGNSAPTAGGLGSVGGTVMLHNTILSNNSGGNCWGTITNGGNNIEDGTTCGWGSVSGSKSNTNPFLDHLANNGGPTQTLALLPGSPAIDKGNDAICAAAVGAPDYGAGGLDQRGVTRPRGFHCDIGAFELDRFSIFLPLVMR